MSSAFIETCTVCGEEPAKYTCPRCSALYGSVTCYQKHSSKCTGEFYTETASEHLRTVVATRDQQQSMRDILRRLHETDLGGASSDEESDEEQASDPAHESIMSTRTLHRLAAKLAAGQDIDISDLSDGEERAFCAAVGRGEVTLPVEPWTPWWTLPDASELKLAADGCARVREIVEVGEEEDAAHKSDADLASTSQLPAPPDAPLPPLRLLTAAPPALSVAWSAMQTLAAYAWVLRSFNGNPESDWEGAAGLFLESAPSLQPAAPSGRPQPACSTLDEALAPLDAASAPGPSPARDAADLVALGRSIVVLALVDAARLLQRGSGTSEAPAESRLERDARRQRRRALQAAQRKLVFLLSWANERREEEYALWAALLRERAGSEPDAGIRLTEGRG